MSILRDLIDLKDDVDEVEIPFSNNQRGSIAKESDVGVLQFPALVDSSISLEETTMASKALERQYVSFVAIMTSMDSVTDDRSVKDYISRIHQNFGTNVVTGRLGESSSYLNEFNFSVYAPNIYQNRDAFVSAEEWTIAMMDKIQAIDNDSYVASYNELDTDDKFAANKILLEKRKKGALLVCGNGRKAIDIEENSQFSQIYFVKNESKQTLDIYETKLITPEDNKKINLEKCRDSICNFNRKESKDYDNGLNQTCLNDLYRPSNFRVDGSKEYADKYNPPVQDFFQEADLHQALNVRNFEDPVTLSQDRTDNTITRDILKDNDVKKANELQPTLLHLKTYFKDKDNSLHAVDYMIGVKTIVHKIDSNSMVDNLSKGAKRGKTFFNFIRWTTGEISFFKDFVFAISRTKDDIHTKFKDNSWWNALIRRRKYSKVLSKLNFKQQLVPNATIVVSMETVNKLKSEHGINLFDKKTALDLMDQYFLLGLVIMDSSIEVAHFLFDGRNDFEEYSYNALERENSNSARDIKNIMQVLGRM